VLNNTEVGTFSANATEMDRLIDIADKTDPGAPSSWLPVCSPRLVLTPRRFAGQTNAIDPNIKPYLKRGKLLTYVGAWRESPFASVGQADEPRRTSQDSPTVSFPLAQRSGTTSRSARRLGTRKTFTTRTASSPVRRFLGPSPLRARLTKLGDATVPGMGHCRGGPGAFK